MTNKLGNYIIMTSSCWCISKKVVSGFSLGYLGDIFGYNTIAILTGKKVGNSHIIKIKDCVKIKKEGKDLKGPVFLYEFSMPGLSVWYLDSHWQLE